VGGVQVSAGFKIGDRVRCPLGEGALVWADRYYGTLRLDHQSEPIVVHLQHCTLLPVPIPEGWVNVYDDHEFGTFPTRKDADDWAVEVRGFDGIARIGIWHLRADRTAEYIETPRDGV
jgi:hypothetical protein